MISVLIPVFNYNVSNLVFEIHKQLVTELIDFEIICIDDCSTSLYDENLDVKKLDNVTFIQLTKNIGRSKIRNLLASKAKFDWLLFLDSDVFPRNKNFIKNYIKNIESKKAELYFGGVINQDKKPEKEQMLRWVYGSKRENISCNIRNKNPFKYFLSANFLIKKSIFNLVKFNENIKDYGYEDLIFIEDFKKNKYFKFQHVNNEVYHNGIENSELYILKTKEAIKNLYTLNALDIIDEKQVKILNVFAKLHYLKLTSFLNFVYLKLHKILELNLNSKFPSLFVFDVYKISYYSYLKRNKLS